MTILFPIVNEISTGAMLKALLQLYHERRDRVYNVGICETT